MVTPPPIQLANIGMADSFIIMVLALVVFGPRRLPQIGRQIGKLMYEFRKASNDFKFQMEEELRASEEADRRKKEEAERQRVAALAAQSQESVSAPAQTVEAAADVGAVEPPVPPGYADPYASEASTAGTDAAEPASAEATLVIQPPSTGEQVSAVRPEYHFDSLESNSTTEVNPDADVAANAEEFAASGGSAKESQPASEPGPSAEVAAIPEAGSQNAPGTSAKEIVSQHG